MFGLLLLAFLIVPIIELYLFVEVSNQIGFGAALLWIVGVSIVGAWLVKREGMSAFRRANQKVAAGEVPTDELITGILILFAGALMLTPGFLTDAVGMLLLFPPSRALVRHRLRGRFATGPIVIGGRFGPGGFGSGGFGSGGFGTGGFGSRGSGSPEGGASDVWDVDSWEDPPDRRELD